MYENEVEISWALLLDTRYPQCAKKKDGVGLHKDLEGLHRRRSSTYWMSLLGERLRELRLVVGPG
jgi:hypothetical protein